MRRFLWLFIPSLLVYFTLSVLWHYSERKLATFAISRAKETLQKMIRWDLEVQSLRINLAPPGIEVKGLKLSPPSPSNWMTPLEVKAITANLDFLNLLAGQIKFSIIRFEEIQTRLAFENIPTSKERSTQLPINEIFDALQVIPIKMVLVENTNVSLQVTKNSPPMSLNGDLLLQTAPQTIHYGIKSKALIASNSQATPEVFNFSSKGSLSTKTLQLTSFELTSEASKIGIQGEFINFSKVITQPHLSGYADVKLDLEDLATWLAFAGLRSTPSIKGQIRSQGKFDIEKWQEPVLQLETQISNAKISDFSIGNLKSHIRFDKKHISSPELTFQHPSGTAQINDLDWNIHKDEISAKIDLQSLDLQKLFLEIHLNRIPVELMIAGNLKCQGKLLNSFNLDCEGNVEGKKLDVRSQFHGPGAPIIALERFSGEGTVSVDAKEVTYSSSVILPLSQGRSHGVINYETGFVIDFETEALDFKDASPLANLTFDGKGKLQGRTQGNSQTATLDIALSTQDFWFENFELGNIEGKVSYQKGHLLIDAPQAKLFNSLYMAQLDVDLVQSRLKGLVESPELYASDAIIALSKRVPIPFTATGVGKTRAQFEGPFHLGKLNYHFDGILQKGDIQGETYDEIKWDWVAKDGLVTIDNNTLQKGKALITINGKSMPTGHLTLEVDGNNFKLENSTFLSRYVKTLGGDIDFHMSINNHILKPDIFLEGKIEHTTLGDSELPDSKFIFETDSLGRSLTLDLIGHQIRVDLDLPYKEDDQARLFMEVQKFDFADFLALLMGSPLRNDYRSLLSFKMDIQSEDNNIFASSGIARIDDLYLARGEHFLRNSKPMFVYFDNGMATLKDFSVKGFQSEILATGEDFSPSQLKVNFGGSIDLRLLQLFTPFLDDISGPVKGQIRLSGSLKSPEVYGDLDLHEVDVKLKGFSPLFDHINSHLEFSQKRIIIESIRGSLAGGSLVGDGSININGLKDVRVDVKAQLRNLQMEVPEHVQSSGSGDVVFSGNWFPYTLSGSYRVTQAFIDKDFSTDSTDNNVRQSVYLPKNIANSGFDPVVLDLQIFLDKKVEIKNPQMSGFLTGQLQVKGPPQNPILLGSVKTLPQAQLFFRDKIFEVQSGLVKFNDPTELNPELYFTARSIVDKYEISLLLQGKAKSSQLSFTSQPPLQEQDIISLLALGVTTQKLDSQIDSSQQAAQTGYQLGTAIISANPLNKEIKQSLGVDVKFSSGFDDTKNVALPRVTVSKDIIPRKLNASATSSFSENQHYDVRFQYLLNDRWSTVVTYEKSAGQEGTSTTSGHQSETSVFGLDLEYKVEFK